MSENRKQFDAQIKSIDAAAGRITRIVSVFGNVDHQKERVIPGAFSATIEKWAAKMERGRFLPVVFGHKDDPSAILGKVVGLRQTDEGLEVDEEYFLHKPSAKDAFEAQREGVLDGSSFAYDIRRAKRASDGVLDLLELDLMEVGPTIYPANTETRLVSVKGSPSEAVKVPEATEVKVLEAPATKHNALSKHKSSVRQIRDLADEMLAELDRLEAAVKAEEPEGVKAEAPAEMLPALAAAREQLLAELTTEGIEMK